MYIKCRRRECFCVLVSIKHVRNKPPLKDSDDDVLQEDLGIHRLRLFENRVLRRMFGPKRKEGAGARKIQ
jgi:hypothetical protein